jgi:hypothetical protein
MGCEGRDCLKQETIEGRNVLMIRSGSRTAATQVAQALPTEAADMYVVSPKLKTQVSQYTTTDIKNICLSNSAHM